MASTLSQRVWAYYKKMPKKILLFIVVFIVIVIFIAHAQITSNTEISPQKSLVTETVSSSSPEPFSEMTIPYLRTRSYESTLGEQTKYTETATYTSYLTSYTSDGLKINGLLTIPKGTASKWPAIVFVHGYIPPTLYKTTEKYIEYVDYLARNGFVVFKIDLRGHGNSEGEAKGGYFSSDYVIDTLNARAALEQADFVDKNKIGLWGHSMAGNVVMRAWATRPEIPAVTIWAGAVYTYLDQREFGINDQSYRPSSDNTKRQAERAKLRELYGDPTEGSVFWTQVAPTSYLQDLKGALQIHHAIDDTVVNIGYSRNLMKLFDSTSVPHELFEYPTGGHNISGNSFSSAMSRTVEFFKKM